jgi:hypothetical protein
MEAFLKGKTAHLRYHCRKCLHPFGASYNHYYGGNSNLINKILLMNLLN